MLTYLVPYILLMTLQYSFTKDGLRFASPPIFTAIRYSIAAFTVFALARGFRLILNKDTILLSLFTALASILWIYGLKLVSPAESAVLSYAMPLFAIPLSTFILKEQTTTIVWVGAAVGFAGVSIYGITLGTSGGTVLGAILTVANAMFWGLWTIYYRKVRSQDPLTTVATQFSICALILWLITPVGFTMTINFEFIFDLAYYSLLGGVAAFFLWNAMARMETMGKLTTFVFAVPAATILLQSIETGNTPGLYSLLGVTFMFLGIFISRLSSFKPRKTSEVIS